MDFGYSTNLFSSGERFINFRISLDFITLNVCVHDFIFQTCSNLCSNSLINYSNNKL